MMEIIKPMKDCGCTGEERCEICITLEEIREVLLS